MIHIAALPFALALLAGIICRAVAGDGLGFYFGGIVMAALLLPPLCARLKFWIDALIAAAAVVDGLGVVWLINGQLWQWMQAYLVLVAFGCALAGLVLLSRRAIGATAGAGVVTIIAMLWLAWPVWLSPHLNGTAGASLAGNLASPHPLFAINRVFIDQGVWTQQPIMYRLTALGQDVPYSFPATIWPEVVIHAALGSVAFVASFALKAARRPPASPEH